MKRIFLQQYFYRRIMRMKRIFLVTKRNSQNSSNSPFYLSRFKSFLSFFCASEKLTHFVLSNQKISLFLPSPFREKSIWSEKAHSSLCSSEVNLDNSRNEKRILKDGYFRCYVAFTTHNINSGANLLFIFSFHGSPSPTSGNKDKFGRLRSLCQK